MRSARLCVLLAACIGFLPGCSKKEKPKAAEEGKPDKAAISQEEVDRDKAKERDMQRKMEAEARAGEKDMKAAMARQAAEERAAVKEMRDMANEAEKEGDKAGKAITSGKKAAQPKKKGKADK